MNGISGLKNKLFVLSILSMLFITSCKDAAKDKEAKPIVEESVSMTNIRFATKADNYQEKSSYNRLTTGKTEITSKIFQMEGPAWENENVAFRNYFDTRNGMDIFGKRVKRNVLDSVGIDENYHELQDWGMDVLKVGNSLGAGAIGMIIKDSLYRIGPDSKGSFRIISETPTESSLEFTFENWNILDRTYKISHIINISAGTHYYTGIVKVEGGKGDEEFVTGIVDHAVGKEEFTTGNHIVVSTHGAQEVEGKILGMAIAVHKDNFARNEKADKYKGTIDQTHLVVLKGDELKYHFFAGWELEDIGFKEKNYFNDLIKKELGVIE